MQPIEEDRQEEVHRANGFSNGPSTINAGQHPTSQQMNFNSASFGQTLQSNLSAHMPAKRPNIDESWVNVDWSEIARKSQQNSPPKSPKVEHQMASVLHPPSEIETKNRTETGLFTGEYKGQKMESNKSFGFDRFGPEKTNEIQSASKPTATDYSFSKSPTKDERSKIPQMAPKSPLMKPVTLTRESTHTLPSISLTPQSTSLPAGTHESLRFNGISSVKADKSRPSPIKEDTPRPLPIKEDVYKSSMAKEVTYNPTSIRDEPYSSTPPKVKPFKDTHDGDDVDRSKNAGIIPPQSHTTPAKEPSMIENQEDGQTSTPKTTPKTRTPRKSATTTPTTPRSSGRTRKAVNRLSPSPMEHHHEPKAIEIPEGNGTRFVDISHISKELSKRKSDYQPIITLHRILFGRPGESGKRKGSLRQFNGLASSDDMPKIVEKLDHHTVDELRNICGLLNLERSGEKKTLTDRIVKYLRHPIDLGESKPTRRVTLQKRGKNSPGRKKTTKGKTSKSEAREEDGDEDEDEDEEEASNESGIEEKDMLADLEDQAEESHEINPQN